MKIDDRIPGEVWAEAFVDFTKTMHDFQLRHNQGDFVLNDIAVMFAHYFAMTNATMWKKSPNQLAELLEFASVAGAKMTDAMQAILTTKFREEGKLN